MRPQGRIIWTDDIRVSSPVAGAALGAMVVHPEFCGVNHTFLTMSACMVGPRWANTTSYINEAYKGECGFHGNTVENAISLQLPSVLPRWSQPSVKFSRAWAESLNPVINVQNRTVADNLLRLLPITSDICPMDDSYSIIDGDLPDDVIHRPFMHERLIASLVANGMSHAAGGIAQLESPYYERLHRLPDGILALTFQGRLLGYVWNLDGTPIRIAVPILFLYRVYALVYVLFTLITGRSSMAWGSISGFTALAINSDPTESLEHTSAGIERMSTFRKVISVREVEVDKGLKLVFEQDEEKKGLCRRVAVGRAY